MRKRNVLEVRLPKACENIDVLEGKTMEYIVRTHFLEKLIALKDKNVIKVVSGIRRCGKSTLFKLYIEWLLKNGVKKEQIISYNFEDFALKEYVENPFLLHDDILKFAENKEKTYLFLDEIQIVKDFERLVNSLHLRENIDVYITGSNAYLLSGELATFLTGRFIQIKMLPLSFSEFVSAQKDKSRLDLLFSQYMVKGGFPETLHLPQNEISKYISDVYSSILQKDIMVRHKWRKTEYFEKLVRFMFDSVGSPLSANNISKQLKASGFDISNHTADTYVEAVCQSYIFYKALRYNIKGKMILSTQEKYYTADLGFKQALSGAWQNSNIGHNLENIIYLELLRRDKIVYIGKANDTEIDFVSITHGGDTEYIQVAWTAKDEKTLDREIRPFEIIRDYNKRTLITMDVEPQSSFNGIKKVNAIDWLLEK